MNNPIKQLSIQELLNGQATYEIPMYQRNYAWGQAEIEQLIQDVSDSQAFSVGSARQYYIGTLVVFRKADDASGRPIYEVIDGQQRLTTLFLLATYFKRGAGQHIEFDMQWFQRQCLNFESRPHSLATLNALFSGTFEAHATGELPDAANSDSIRAGYENIQTLVPAALGATRKTLNQAATRLTEFAEQLFHNTQIMLVEVPEHTDLNHYFEVMNNRGEQLEKHEVLKALMMSRLHDSGSARQTKAWLRTLSRVWEACSHMERYVQMGFTVEQRHRLFGERDWSRLLPENFDALHEVLTGAEPQESPHNPVETAPETRMLLTDLIQGARGQNVASQTPSGQERGLPNPEDMGERFGSVINFPNFLLQVLRTTTGKDIALDDKNLIPAFKQELLRHADAGDRIKQFTYDLLKCKYLYDHYIIKREHLANDSHWSLKRLIWRNSGPDYVNTFGAAEHSPTLNRRILMLLSAMHVSTPTLVYKHWLNAALHYLYHAQEVTGSAYLQHMEGIARCFIYDRFLSRRGEADYYEIIYQRKGQLQAKDWDTGIDETRLTFGNIANNLVFNYLDYLLWLRQGADANFHFTFRSSVEHYYPQNPKFDIPHLPEDILNSFGNLCLVSHDKNSSMSNHSPAAKRQYYKKGKEDSLKQGLMMWGYEEWGEESIAVHSAEMVGVFRGDFEKGSTAQPAALAAISAL